MIRPTTCGPVQNLKRSLLEMLDMARSRRLGEWIGDGPQPKEPLAFIFEAAGRQSDPIAAIDRPRDRLTKRRVAAASMQSEKPRFAVCSRNGMRTRKRTGARRCCRTIHLTTVATPKFYLVRPYRVLAHPVRPSSTHFPRTLARPSVNANPNYFAAQALPSSP
jgi:hypothetical protein